MFKFLFFNRVCVFCVCVCVAGNMVEFCLPHDINLDGVEFKSMASGSHRIANDFMYVFPLDWQTFSTRHQSFTRLALPPPRPDTSARAATLAWRVSPTCLWRASWSEVPGWSRWGSCVPPTLCSTATCTSWRTKSGQTYPLVCLSILAPLLHPVCAQCTVFAAALCPHPILAPFSCCFFLPSIKHESRKPQLQLRSQTLVTHAATVWSRNRRGLDSVSGPWLCSALFCSSHANLISWIPGCHSWLGLPNEAK